jgi:predicted site-specific integrase-resolvase
MSKYVKPAFLQEHYQISSQTIRRWVDTGKVKSIKLPDSGHRLIDYDDFVKFVGADSLDDAPKIRKRICYARVSSSHHKGDLDRQVDLLKSKYPSHDIIKDVGSGLNWSRKGFLSLLELVLSGVVEQVVVTHSDRLSRFSYELLQWLFTKYNCSILVLYEVTESNPDIEMSQDILSIINYFTAKHNGMRSAANKKNRAVEKQKNQTLPDDGSEASTKAVVRI